MGLLKKRSAKSGLPPGSLVHVGNRPDALNPQIQIFQYNAQGFTENSSASLQDCLKKLSENSVTWINVDSLNVATVETLGKHFEVHPLILEDILNTTQRPKLEDLNQIFLVLKMISFDAAKSKLNVEQVSLVIGNNWVISFQEEPLWDVFDPVRARLRNATSRLRSLKVDSLAHALIDAVVDHYFVVLEQIGEAIEALESDILQAPTKESVGKLYELRRDVLFLRKAIWPLREVVDELYRSENSIVQESTRVFFKDVADHTVQIIDMTEIFREMLSGILEIYLSMISQRTNNIMKVLTLFTAIFIPLTFIAGIYGMNFDNMPELHWKWGYPGVLGLMTLVATSTVLYFKKNKWL